MRTCEEYRTLISALIDDEIGDEDRVSLMTHLVECEACREYWKDQLTIREALHSMECSVPDGFAAGIMKRVRETKQEAPRKKTVAFPRWARFAGLAACCAVIALGIFASNGGVMTMDASTTSGSAAPQMAYSADAVAETEEADGAAVTESIREMPSAGSGEIPPQSEGDAGACVTDSTSCVAEYGRMAEYAGCITTGSEIAAQWVEETLGEAWVSGADYLLTAQEYSELLDLLEESGEDYETLEGTGELYQLLAG